MARDFSELNKYAQREYKFVQANSYRLISEDTGTGDLAEEIEDGVCMAVTLNWIKEKLSSSNSYIKPEGRIRGDAPRQFSNSINPMSRAKAGLSVPGGTSLAKVVASNSHLNKAFKGNSHKRNEVTMRQAAELQTTYNLNNLSSAIDEVSLHRVNYPTQLIRRDIGQRPDRERVLGDANWDLPRIRGYNPQDYSYLIPDSIARAANRLAPGVAILIELNNANGGGGHAIAFYRSRQGSLGFGGRTLHFFDSNAGVYRVGNSTEANLKNLIEAWLRAYTNYISPATFRISGSDWCTAFARPEE